MQIFASVCNRDVCIAAVLVAAVAGGYWRRLMGKNPPSDAEAAYNQRARARVGEHRNRENIPFVPCAALPIIDSCGTGKTRGKHGRKTCVCVLFAATATAITLFILIRLVA